MNDLPGLTRNPHDALPFHCVRGEDFDSWRKLQLPAGQLSDLAGRLAKFRGRPLSFQSSRDGRLKMLVLDEVVTASPLAP